MLVSGYWLAGHALKRTELNSTTSLQPDVRFWNLGRDSDSSLLSVQLHTCAGMFSHKYGSISKEDLLLNCLNL